MTIPIIYNLRSVRERWWANLVAVLAVAGVVAVFIAVLSMAKGFQLTLIESGSDQNALVRRGGATSEMDSFIYLENVKIMSNAAQVARTPHDRPLASPELVVVAAFRHKSSEADAMAQVRGITETAMEVHDKVKIVQGRFLQSGLPELMVGSEASRIYENLGLGASVKLGGRVFIVVGIFSAGGTAFDSEVWADQVILAETYKRPPDLVSSLTLRLRSPNDFDALKETLLKDPRLTVQVDREIDYYRKQSRALTTIIKVLGYLVATVMGIGAIFGAFNTMYATVSTRTRELATLRAIGFKEISILASMMTESAIIACVGGILGAILVLPLNNFTASTLNWQTFSQVAFAFRITPDLILMGILSSVIVGLLGGFIPSLRAARMPLATALREL